MKKLNRRDAEAQRKIKGLVKIDILILFVLLKKLCVSASLR
jgi:hypothetical protein